jgi:hypothetical protein
VPILLDNLTCLDAAQEARNLAARGYAPSPQFFRANCLVNPLGESCARAWVLLLRSQVNGLDLNALHNLTFWDQRNTKLTAQNLIVTREPENISPGGPNDRNAAYLVELADARWRVSNPYYQIPANKQYNVRAPAYGGEYLAASCSDGVSTGWTWSGMIGDLWGLLAGQLGAYPGIPWTPNGTPEGWVFAGVAAWPALCRVLWRIGCAVKWNPTAGTYTIVQVGAADAATTATLAAADQPPLRKLIDAEFQPLNRARIPEKYRVFFHHTDFHYGTEETTQQTAAAWSTQAANFVDVASGATGAEAGTLGILWDDLPALFDSTGAQLNAAAMATRAAERAADAVRMMQAGGARLRKVYSGLVNVAPGSILKGVAWRSDAGGEAKDGIVTEIVNHPYRMLRADDAGQWAEAEGYDSTSIQPPDLAPSYPTYTHLLQVLRLVSGVAVDNDGRFDAWVQRRNPDLLTWVDTEHVWAFDLGGALALSRTTRYHGRLNGFNDGRPIYDIVGTVGGIDGEPGGGGGGPCDCPPPVNLLTSGLNPYLPGFPPGSLVFSCSTGLLQIWCGGYAWCFQLYRCGTGPLSGTITGATLTTFISGISGASGTTTICIQGVCSLCPNPPAYWTVPAAGFLGACAYFNAPGGGAWTLEPAAFCTWEAIQSVTINGVTEVVTVTWQLGALECVLNFSYTDASGVYHSASYTFSSAQLASLNCCDPIVALLTQCGCIAQPVVPAQCGSCPPVGANNTFPFVINQFFVGPTTTAFGLCFSAFFNLLTDGFFNTNGWQQVAGSPCTYVLSIPDTAYQVGCTGTLTIDPTTGMFTVTMTVTDTGATVTYTGVATGLDDTGTCTCYGPHTLSLVYSDVGTCAFAGNFAPYNNAPATIIATSGVNCDSSSYVPGSLEDRPTTPRRSGACPSEMIVTPFCCPTGVGGPGGGGAGPGGGGQCSYTVTATLDWSHTSFPDLALYVRNISQAGAVCYYNNLVAGGLTLNHDAFPGCASSPTPPEIITGSFQGNQTFQVWYNQRTTCAPQTAPSTQTFVVQNTGSVNIYVQTGGPSGPLVTISPGGSATVLTQFDFAGVANGNQSNAEGAEVVITCGAPAGQGGGGGGPGGTCNCYGVQLNARLFVTPLGTGTPLDGVKIPITCTNPGSGLWTGTATFCGGAPTTITLSCNETAVSMQFMGGIAGGMPVGCWGGGSIAANQLISGGLPQTFGMTTGSGVGCCPASFEAVLSSS